MSTILSVLMAAVFLMNIVSCTGNHTGIAPADKTVRFIGEAEFIDDPTLRGSFDHVLVTWLEPAHLPQHASDTGIAGQDHLPIIVTHDEIRIFSMDDAGGYPNTMKLIDANDTIIAETGVGQPPAIVKLKAGEYTIVIQRASNGEDSDNMMSIVMPLQRVEAAATVVSKAQSLPKSVSSPSAVVNPTFTDAATQANVKVLGDAPAIAMGNLYQATAQALANAAHNATTAQQQSAITMQATTTMGVTTLYAIDDASCTAIATSKIFQ